MSKSILMYGHDPFVIETRRLVLERRGYSVVTTRDPADLAPKLESGQFDLFLLCHSLTTDDCDSVLEMARTQWPSVKRLVLTSGNLGCSNHRGAAVYDTTYGPDKLLATVAEIVQPQSPQP